MHNMCFGILLHYVLLHTDTGVDFTILASSVRFLEGSSPGHTECISVMIIDDDDYEGDQMFTVIRNPLILMPSIASISGRVVITVRDNAGKIKALQCLCKLGFLG